MAFKDKLKNALAFLNNIKFSQEHLIDGSLIQYEGEAITMSEDVFLASGAGLFSVLPDGEYVTRNNTNFTIKDGKVFALSGVAPVAPVTPVLQAQSTQEELVEAVKELKEEIAELAAGDEEVGAVIAKVPEEVAEEVALADANVTVDINTVISSALAPIWDAIGNLSKSIDNLTSLYVSNDSFSKVKTELKAVKDVVNILAAIPSAEPIEKEHTAFRSAQKTEETESMNFKALQFINK